MNWIRYIIAFAIFMHGIAHISGFLAAWTRAEVGYPDRPWLLSKNVGLQSPVGRIFGLLWLAAAFTLAATGFGLAFGLKWWPVTALLGAAISLFVIMPWLRSVPPGAWVGAIFDMGIILALTLPLKDQLTRLLA